MHFRKQDDAFQMFGYYVCHVWFYFENLNDVYKQFDDPQHVWATLTMVDFIWRGQMRLSDFFCMKIKHFDVMADQILLLRRNDEASARFEYLCKDFDVLSLESESFC